MRAAPAVRASVVEGTWRVEPHPGRNASRSCGSTSGNPTRRRNVRRQRVLGRFEGGSLADPHGGPPTGAGWVARPTTLRAGLGRNQPRAGGAAAASTKRPPLRRGQARSRGRDGARGCAKGRLTLQSQHHLSPEGSGIVRASRGPGVAEGVLGRRSGLGACETFHEARRRRPGPTGSTRDHRSPGSDLICGPTLGTSTSFDGEALPGPRGDGASEVRSKETGG